MKGEHEVQRFQHQKVVQVAYVRIPAKKQVPVAGFEGLYARVAVAEQGGDAEKPQIKGFMMVSVSAIT